MEQKKISYVDPDHILRTEIKTAIEDQLFHEWKKRLGLQDWSICFQKNCKPEEMRMEGVAGCADWTEANKTAVIQILDPEYYGDRIVPFDYEKILVHELLHLKLCLVSDCVPDIQARYMHQIIDDLARAFVNAKRSSMMNYKIFVEPSADEMDDGKQNVMVLKAKGDLCVRVKN